MLPLIGLTTYREQARWGVWDQRADVLQVEYADAVVRAYLHGEAYADLAQRYGVPLNTIRTWLRRSLLKLRECLGP